MQIAILTTAHPALDGRIFYKQAISLTRAGHAVTLFAPAHMPAAAIAAQYGIKFVSLKQDAGRFTRPQRWWQLMKLLWQTPYDVWHFHDFELLLLAIIWHMLFARHTQLIYDVHEDVPKDILDKPWIAPVLRKPISKFVDYLEQWGMRQCDFLIAATDSILLRVQAARCPCSVVNNFPLIQLPQMTKSTFPSNNGCVRVIYAGGLTEIRGIRQLVHAMSLLDGSNIELLLLGEFYPESFQQEIRQSAGKNVILYGKVPFTQVPQFLSESHIGIVCFLPAANHLEAMPNKLFEYMQAGLPVIASNFPLWQNIIKEAQCGVVVDPCVPQQIADAIRQLANDPATRQHLGKAGQQAIYEKYSWQNEAKTLLAAYAYLEKTQ